MGHYRDDPRARRFLFWPFFVIIGGAISLIVGTWNAPDPVCSTMLRPTDLDRLSLASVGKPEVSVSHGLCVAEWDAIRVEIRSLAVDELQFERRVESWRAEPGFVSKRDVEGLGDRAQIGRMEQIRFGGHIRSERLLVGRAAGWVEVRVTHRWSEPKPAPAAADHVDEELIAMVRQRLAASNGFFAR